MTVFKGNLVFYFYSPPSSITIMNETLVNNVLDDLYQIGSATNVYVKNFQVRGNVNTGSITETSAILSVSTASGVCIIDNFQVSDSIFIYGKAIEID